MRRQRKADLLRQEAEIAIKVAELEDQLVDLKAFSPGALRRAAKAKLRVAVSAGDAKAALVAAQALLDADDAAVDPELVRVKEELRAWRCALRLGRPLDVAVVNDETGEVVVGRNGRPLKVRVHNGFNIVGGELVAKGA